MDYWVIEWCHRVEVRQFHLEVPHTSPRKQIRRDSLRLVTLSPCFPRGRASDILRQMIDGQAMRSPDYSLGTYERSAIVRERGDIQNKSARIVKVPTLTQRHPWVAM